MADRTPIPEKIKKLVRQRCGFSCVLCGLPVYDYDHIIPWAEVREHQAGNLTLLCPQHHREKTSGLRTDEEIKKANENPISRRNGHTAPYKLNYSGGEFAIQIGGAEFGVNEIGEQDSLIPLVIDGQPMVAFHVEDGNLLLDLFMYDENNYPILVIHRNELVLMVNIWDITFISNRLRVESKQMNVLVVIEFCLPGKVWIKQGVFMKNGIKFEITESNFRFGQTILNLGKVKSRIGIVLGVAVQHQIVDTSGAAFMNTEINRYSASTEYGKLNIGELRNG